MRAQLLALLASSAAALRFSVPDAKLEARQDNGNNGEIVGALPDGIPNFHTREFPLLTPEQALNALYAKARATPAAVNFLPGVPVPSDIAKSQKTAGVAPMHIDMTEGAVPKDSNNYKAPQLHTDATNAAQTCTNPAVHYEWSNLTPQHQQQFVASMHCLSTKPARSGLAGTKTRWDDLVAIHQLMSPIIHNVGQFLAWHRYFLHILELEMRGTCGYTGPMTWWDETKNAGNFNAAPMMTTSFFGHMPNLPPVVCIISGAWANFQCNIGPGTSDTRHCLSRGCNETMTAVINQNFVNYCNSNNDFESMNNCVFFGPHAYGHDSIGGVMSDVDTSPNDPVFYLHHAFVDHGYRIWQNMNSARLTQIGGYTTQNCGSNCQPTTLNYVLSSFNFYPSVTVGDVMNTEGGYLCYKYDY